MNIIVPCQPLYLRVPVDVKHRDLIARIIPPSAISLLAGMLLATTGCVAAASTTITISPYLIAVRYDVEPQFAAQGRRQAIETIRRDFQAVAKLGFNSVVLHHVDDRDGRMLLNLADANGLMVALPRRSFHHFLSMGVLPDGITDLEELAATIPSEIAGHAALAALVINPPPSRHVADRCDRLCAIVNRQGPPCVSLGGGGANALARIDIGFPDPGSESSPREHWLAQFHEALAAGKTAGVVMDRYRRPPGDPPALASSSGLLSPARATALREVIIRARRWGLRIHRSTVQPIPSATPAGVDLTVRALILGRRRYVLVFNPSTVRYAREEVVLPASMNGSVVTRAVEVPASASLPTGHVVVAGNGQLVLPVVLRPGDAALFELF